ncbi:MAG: hypothetical protein H7301_01305 [Cryobacterium sp.]|nr:hypothetical protein [Oligoflexia bacterium]
MSHSPKNLILTVAIACSLHLPVNALGARITDPVAYCQTLLIESSLVGEQKSRVAILGRSLVEDFPIIQSEGFYARLWDLLGKRSANQEREYLRLVEESVSPDAETRKEAKNAYLEMFVGHNPVDLFFQGKPVTLRELDRWDAKTFIAFKSYMVETLGEEVFGWLLGHDKEAFKRNAISIFTPRGHDIRADMHAMSEVIWDDIAAALLGKNAEKLAKNYGVDRKDLPVVQALIRTINIEPTLRAAAGDLVDLIFLHSLPHLKNIAQMRDNDTFGKAFAKVPTEAIPAAFPFVSVYAVLNPFTYCYIGNCAKVATTQSFLEKKAYRAAIAETTRVDEESIPAPEPQVFRADSVSLTKSAERFSQLREKLKKIPGRELLEKAPEIANFDREIRKAIHESAVLGLTDHEVFSNQAIWSSFSEFLEKNPDTENLGRVPFLQKIDTYRVHVENYTQSLKYQLAGLLTARRGYQQMESLVRTEIGSEGSSGGLRLHELKSLLARLEGQASESSVMEKSIEIWTLKTEKIISALECIKKSADPLRGASLTRKEIGQLKSEILADIGIKEHKAWYRF